MQEPDPLKLVDLFGRVSSEINLWFKENPKEPGKSVALLGMHLIAAYVADCADSDRKEALKVVADGISNHPYLSK
jgi:hypothetical protein